MGRRRCEKVTHAGQHRQGTEAGRRCEVGIVSVVGSERVSGQVKTEKGVSMVGRRGVGAGVGEKGLSLKQLPRGRAKVGE